MADDLDLAVLEFMQEDGFIATYIKRDIGEYDPAQGAPSATVTEIPVEAIMMDLTLQSNGASVKFGTQIEAGDKELYIRPIEELPTISPSSDTVKIGTTEYRIVTFKEVNPSASNPILFNLYIRR